LRHLITGGAGFIGSHLAEELLRRGDEVFILDDLSTGSVENIRHLKTQARFHYSFDSITNKQLLAELVDESDVIFHLAAAVGVRLIVESPVRTIETNVYGTQLVLDAASKKKKLVVTASTSEVYGKSNKVPFHEDDDLVLGATTKGRWSYAASNALDEFLALSYWKEKKQPVIVVRLFNTVGPRQTGRYGMVLPSFVQQALEGAPITVYGSGKQSRCFCDVRDTVEAILRLIANDRAVGEVVNIGSDEEISMEGLAQVVKQRAKSNSIITYTPYDQAYEPGFEDMPRRVPSTEKLQRLTGFRPTTPLSEIVDRVIAHFPGKTGTELAPSASSVSAVAASNL
jgi:UDP-glucose 4-epimerase